MGVGVFEVREFEVIDVTPFTALLRVSVDSSRGGSAQWAPTLVVTDGEQRERLSPLPTGPDPPGALLAAFRLPAARMESELTFSLEIDEETVLELGTPVHHSLPHRTPERANRAASTQAVARAIFAGTSNASPQPQPLAEPQPQPLAGSHSKQPAESAATPAGPAAAPASGEAQTARPTPAEPPRVPAGDSPLDRWLVNAMGALGAADYVASASPTEPASDRWLDHAQDALERASQQPRDAAPHRHHDGTATDRLQPYLPEPASDPSQVLDQLISQLAEMGPRRAVDGDARRAL